jgi:16S rRNA (cytidine1402-2'-O)-methyltransferase
MEKSDYMKRQKSFHNDYATLYLVATPIGNLSDMTFRAIETLENVDFIYAEDTRVSGKLLKHFEITTKQNTYHDFNKEMKSDEILERLREGKNIALISDAGYPLISDPGYYLIREALKEDFNVVSIPGASALLGALVVSGLVPHPFTFIGFLNSKETKRVKELESHKDRKETIIFYESPNRINKTIKSMYEVFGERDLVIARELTKKFEEIIRGTTLSLIDVTDIKGECVIVVSGKPNTIEETNLTLLEEVEKYISEGDTSKEAIKKVAKSRDLTKNEVYMEYHKN